jgi:hypothetical protein
MSAGANNTFRVGLGKGAFGLLMREIFALDSAVHWIALEQAGREPRWAWRDSNTGQLYAGASANNAELLDPLLLMLAEGHVELDSRRATANPHHLRFVVLAYEDSSQIVARFGSDAHISVAVDVHADAYVFGARLTGLLNRPAHGPHTW